MHIDYSRGYCIFIFHYSTDIGLKMEEAQKQPSLYSPFCIAEMKRESTWSKIIIFGFRVIDVVSALDVQGFTSHKGLETCVNRLCVSGLIRLPPPFPSRSLSPSLPLSSLHPALNWIK